MENLKQKIFSLEKQLLRPASQQSLHIGNLLHDDFQEIGRHQQATNKKGALSWILSNNVDVEWWLTDYSVQKLSDDVLLASYVSQEKIPEGCWAKATNRSSVWVWLDQRWQLRFHQGTEIS